jgi:sec-independent protein translocase protein TatC
VEPSKSKPKKKKHSWRDYLNAVGKAHNKSRVHLESSETLLQHLNELRVRIFKAFGAVIATTLISVFFAQNFIDYLSKPLGGRDALVSIEITENVAIFMRVALLGGVILGMPFIVYQIMRFLVPGLTDREKLWLLLGVPFASLLFLSGVAFTWFVMIPTAVPFLTNFLNIRTQVRPLNYFGFITNLMFWIGLCFEMPLLVMFLAKLKFITAKQLATGWRYAFVAIAVLAAAVTPTVDPINMGLVMLPLMGLYVISIILAKFMEKN